MDLYLHTGGRSKGEWFPESIQGLFRASRTECQDDLDHIQACLPIAAQRGGEGDEEGEGLDDELDGAAASARAHAARHNKRKSNKYERQEAELAAEAAISKRARLNLKIQQERSEHMTHRAAAARARSPACWRGVLKRVECSLPLVLCFVILLTSLCVCSQRLESTKESGYHLRQNLDSLRAETQQYEDAIAQTKREMEMIQRETQM